MFSFLSTIFVDNITSQIEIIVSHQKLSSLLLFKDMFQHTEIES